MNHRIGFLAVLGFALSLAGLSALALATRLMSGGEFDRRESVRAIGEQKPRDDARGVAPPIGFEAIPAPRGSPGPG